MGAAGTGANVRLTDMSDVWSDEQQSSEIHLTVNDGDPQSGNEGLHLVISTNPRSANFDPNSFNTLRTLLAQFEKPCPGVEADETISRQLARRTAHIA